MNSRAAVIILEDGKVLLVHRIKGARDYWVLPGGSIKTGESREQACCREAKEETGLDIKIERHVLTFSNKGLEEAYFLASPTGGTLELGEPEKSRQSQSNQYILEWIEPTVFDKINFQPEQLKATIAELINGADT